ncbi:hypothetical protein C8A00DRAFT_17797 [Chaetomidium leptoderma]|uniref:Uncharacterized protein n=1 Tax=Chaetomidium leptoderma TaxID=669021 RepID=A0AAN6VG86_9PEZI|nr:hypothetical protein C8A00DRAFT_17797 [Chaetomidium leptoderma]
MHVHTSQLLSSSRASKALGKCSQGTRGAHPSVRAPSPQQCDIHTSRLETQLSPVRLQHNRTQPKSQSVADLRKAFEQKSEPNGPAVSSVSLPNTPKRVSRQGVKRLANSGDSRKELYLHRDSRRSGQTPDAHDLAAAYTPVRPPRQQSDRQRGLQASGASTIRQARGRALRASLIDELSQTIRCRAGESPKRGDISHQTAASTPGPGSTDTRPLLLSRTLSIKAHTIAPNPRSGLQNTSPTKSTKQDANGRSVGRSNVDESEKATLVPSASPYLQHWRTRKDMGASKSSPSLPIIVSTTIATSTRSAVRRTSSSVSLVARRSMAFDSRQKLTQVSSKEGFQGAFRGTNTSDASRSEVSETRESPVRHRIRLFENIGYSTRGRQTSQSKFFERNAAPLGGSIKHPSGKRLSMWQQRRVSQTSTRPGRESSFSFRATLRKISKSHESAKGRLSSDVTAEPRPRASPSTELLNKTAGIAPRPFFSTRTSPAPAHAHDITNPWSTSLRKQHSQSGLNNQSWGRRAAAAAFDIGRRFKARKASSSSRLSVSLSVDSGHDEGGGDDTTTTTTTTTTTRNGGVAARGQGRTESGAIDRLELATGAMTTEYGEH